MGLLDWITGDVHYVVLSGGFLVVVSIIYLILYMINKIYNKKLNLKIFEYILRGASFIFGITLMISGLIDLYILYRINY